ncbi:hypothetical protein [Mesorhizobium neociceri]|nr:hypothetical protein [Mesorhizobium neociceri]
MRRPKPPPLQYGGQGVGDATRKPEIAGATCQKPKGARSKTAARAE